MLKAFVFNGLPAFQDFWFRVHLTMNDVTKFWILRCSPIGKGGHLVRHPWSAISDWAVVGLSDIGIKWWIFVGHSDIRLKYLSYFSPSVMNENGWSCMPPGVETKTFFYFREKRKLSKNEQVFAKFLEISFRENFLFRENFHKKFSFVRKFFVFAKVFEIIFVFAQVFPNKFCLRESFRNKISRKQKFLQKFSFKGKFFAKS
jgi:hypothetical protein